MLKHGLQDQLFRMINCANGVSSQVGKSSKCLKHGLQDKLFRMINCVNGECPDRLESRLSD